MLHVIERSDPALDMVGPAHPSVDAVAKARGLSQELFRLASAGDDEGALPPASITALQESGLPLAAFPERFGGAGLIDDRSGQRLVGVLRLVGAGDLSIARIYEGHVNAVALVERYGTEGQMAELAAAVEGGGLSAVWNAEGRMPLTAQATRSGWVLTGDKILASGVGSVTHPLVTPRVDGRVVLMLAGPLERERFDLSSWTPQGMRGSATGTVHLTGLAVPSHAVIGAPDDYPRQPIFSGGAWRFCAVHLGAAERLLDLFRTHLRQRDRDSDPYQKQRIATATTACVSARLWIKRAAAMLASGEEDAAATVAFVNLTRGVTERTCLQVIEAVQRGVGLSAFMRPDPIERIARDLATYLRQPVPDAAMADAAAAVLEADRSVFDLWSD